MRNIFLWRSTAAYSMNPCCFKLQAINDSIKDACMQDDVMLKHDTLIDFALKCARGMIPWNIYMILTGWSSRLGVCHRYRVSDAQLEIVHPRMSLPRTGGPYWDRLHAGEPSLSPGGEISNNPPQCKARKQLLRSHFDFNQPCYSHRTLSDL